MRNRKIMVAICVILAAAVLYLVVVQPFRSASAPSPTPAPASASAEAEPGPSMGPAEPAPSPEPSGGTPPAVMIGPEAAVNPFEAAVLLFEASRYMESPATKNAALAQVATEGYQAEYRMPDDIVGVELTVTAVPSKSKVNISDEYVTDGVTRRTVSTFAHIEKHDRDGKLVNVILADENGMNVTTWVLGQGNTWRIESNGIAKPK